MDLSSQAFRKALPAFLDPNCYSDSAYAFWSKFAQKQMNKDRWGDLYEEGHHFFVAHQMTLEFDSIKAGAKGAKPGQIAGVVTSGSVDKVSFSRDASAAMIENAGHWNLTVYGLRYKMLVNMVGAGPMQVGPHSQSAQGVQGWTGVNYPPY